MVIPIILIIGALIRHFFNIKHTGLKPPYWIIFPVIILLFLSIFISDYGKPQLTKINQNVHLIKDIPKPILSSAQEIIVSKCSMCHAKEPLWDNMHNPPKQLILETAEDIIVNIENIYSQSVASFAMPPGNVSFLENHERAEIEKLYLTILNLTKNK
jgi:uncharacterized membrane protein